MANIRSFCVFLSKYFFLLSVILTPVPAQDAKSKDLIDKINKLRPPWVAGLNPTELPTNYSKPNGENKNVCPECPVVVPKGNVTPPPRFFDTRNKWQATCGKILGRIRHQGQCASDWSVAFVSMVSDRMCISSKGANAIHLSAEHVLNCCKECLKEGTPGCQGGSVGQAAKFWISNGIVTGGETGSSEGCMPYSKESFEGMNTECPAECTNKLHGKSIAEDLHKGGTLYNVPPEEAKIREELFTNGPVLTDIDVYEDLEFYRKGVYKHILGNPQGIHYLKIIGYGVEDREKYWLCASSHGEKYGQNGFFKILRGVNHCNIERNIVAVKFGDGPATEPEPETEPEPDSEEPTEDRTEDPEERKASANDGEVLEPLRARYVLAEIIFVGLYLHWYT